MPPRHVLEVFVFALFLGANTSKMFASWHRFPSFR
jgi:hypothetical protein